MDLYSKFPRAYNDPFFIKSFPQLHPSSNEYIEFWRLQKKRVIEGVWAEVTEEGFTIDTKRPVYMPGPLYFYMNMWHILLEKSAHSKAKVLGRPNVWDIFWEISYVYLEARGFAGFDTQPEVVAYKEYLESGVYDPETEERLKAAIPDVRETLRNPKPEYFGGRPLFLFEAKDFMWLTNRGAGKSYFIAALIAHELLTDGLKHYDPDSKERIPSVEIVVGAGDTKYSNDLLKKVKLGLDNLPGAITIGETYYPPPFAKQLNGSFQPGKVAEHTYKKKVGGSWKQFGTNSKIKHVAWKDNPFAAQGTRPTLQIKEEVGMFDNLKASQEADVETMKAGTVKFGTCIYIGCVCKGSKIWTKDGILINVEDLTQESGTIGYGTGKISLEEVSHINPPRQKPCYRITTNKGTVLECSDDHPVLWSKSGRVATQRFDGLRKRVGKKVEWREAKDVKKGDQLVLANAIPVFKGAEIWEPRILGMLIGDGSYGYDKTPVFSNCDDVLNELIETRLDTVTEKTHITKDNKVYKETRIRGICPQLRSLGIYGQTKENKRLPKAVFEASKHDAAELIGGLFDTDGAVYLSDDKKICQISISQSSLELLKELKALLQKFGVHSNVLTATKDNRNRKICSKKPHYVLAVADKDSVLNFRMNIKLLVEYKQEKLDSFIHTPSTGCTSGVFVTDAQEDKRKTAVSDIHGIRFETVKAVEYIGMQDVYNFTADTTHTYIVNGIITHNTGGDMEGGTLDAYEMFYDPETYSLIAVDDVWEDKGKICIFTPATMGKRQYKYQDGNTNFELAEKQEERFRTEKAQSKSGSSALDSYIQYNPLKPSEIFLTKSGNIFPKKELMEHLGWLETNRRAASMGVPIRLKRGDGGKVEYFIDQKLKPITTFPLKDNQEKEGCVVIYEFPPESGTIPYGMYIAGTDPVDQDDSGTSSLMSTFVYKTFQTFDGTHDIVVAEYTGRPSTAREAYETTMMLMEMYNAKTLYENQLKGFKIYAEENYKLQYLKEQPDILRDVLPSTKVNRGYGTHMTKEIKMQCELWLRDWLLIKRSDGEDGKELFNLHYLPSIPLVKELIMYERDGNYDRVIALMLCIMHKQDNFKIQVVEKQRTLLGDRNKKLFQKTGRRTPFYN